MEREKIEKWNGKRCILGYMHNGTEVKCKIQSVSDNAVNIQDLDDGLNDCIEFKWVDYIKGLTQ